MCVLQRTNDQCQAVESLTCAPLRKGSGLRSEGHPCRKARKREGELCCVAQGQARAVAAPVLRALAAAITLGSGASLGPEGPSVDIGRSSARALGSLLRSKRRLLLPLIAAGSGAGELQRSPSRSCGPHYHSALLGSCMGGWGAHDSDVGLLSSCRRTLSC